MGYIYPLWDIIYPLWDIIYPLWDIYIPSYIYILCGVFVNIHIFFSFETNGTPYIVLDAVGAVSEAAEW